MTNVTYYVEYFGIDGWNVNSTYYELETAEAAMIKASFASGNDCEWRVIEQTTERFVVKRSRNL